MTVPRLRFVSRNLHKLAEAKAILDPLGIVVAPVEKAIEELQTTDTAALVRDKALRAFEYLGEPLFVEHTGLYLDYLNDLPGGLTQIFWDSLQADRFAQLFGHTGNRVLAKTLIGYIDGKKFHLFEGAIAGTISLEPRGPRDFQWDCVFIPDGLTETFAELGTQKNEISMRRKALDRFAAFLKK
ncbi:MAG TPA: non-canonical purine NTP pyrophosphatase [Bryobacteraceae bacterium]|nr:non-canonical purine NTP pyrophosphatase [Bryobacteraceae bacterium]